MQQWQNKMLTLKTFEGLSMIQRYWKALSLANSRERDIQGTKDEDNNEYGFPWWLWRQYQHGYIMLQKEVNCVR